jgi:hypothetical protein
VRHLSKSPDLVNNFALYFDECYHYSWIYPSARKKIMDYFTSGARGIKKFEVFDAEKLKVWMIKRIEDGDACKTVILFSQDMVPEIITPDFSPSVLLRTYLDSGGRIVWIGDVPFFRQGKYCRFLKNKLLSAETKDIPWVEWGISGLFSILGVNVEFNYSPNEKVEITSEGNEWGLRNESKWYGTRPISEEEKGIKVLAKSSAKRLKPSELLKPEEKKSIFDTFSDAVNKISVLSGIILSFITALIAYFSVVGQTQLPSWLGEFSKYLPVEILPVSIFVVLVVFSISLPRIYEKYRLWRRKKYPNAWIKNFNEKYPYSGFVRLWDQQLYDVKDEALEDLFAVSTFKL